MLVIVSGGSYGTRCEGIGTKISNPKKFDDDQLLNNVYAKIASSAFVVDALRTQENLKW
jgi:hypothetical protein